MKSQILELEKYVQELPEGTSGPEGKDRVKHSSRIKELRERIGKIRQEYQDRYQGKIGVFEGAGYTAKGLYRSEVHVGMFYKGDYGPVSEEALERIIRFLTE